MISTRRLTTCIDFTLTKKRHGHRLYKLPRVKQILDGPFLPKVKATESQMKTCLSISPKSILLLCILYFPCTITIRYRFTTSERKPDQQALLILPAQSQPVSSINLGRFLAFAFASQVFNELGRRKPGWYCWMLRFSTCKTKEETVSGSFCTYLN